MVASLLKAATDWDSTLIVLLMSPVSFSHLFWMRNLEEKSITGSFR